jgi:hypothetical protein
MGIRRPRTDLQARLDNLFDEVRGPLGRVWESDPEAAENARCELIVIFEALADETRKMKQQAIKHERDALYGPSAPGRILACLDIPIDHRAWKRLDNVEARAKQDAEERHVQVTSE